MTDNMVSRAFTKRFHGKVSNLETDVGISEPYHPTFETESPPVKRFTGLWDTGATCSVISRNVIDALGIPEINKIHVQTANGIRKSGVYLINIYLPNNVAFSTIEVSDGDLCGIDVLIGMDIIGSGDFAISHRNNSTCMTFECPSRHDLDFVKELDLINSK